MSFTPKKKNQNLSLLAQQRTAEESTVSVSGSFDFEDPEDLYAYHLKLRDYVNRMGEVRQWLGLERGKTLDQLDQETEDLNH